ncbi:hypothetical protein BH10ACI3_BH10ACI3_27630 [soil metagenome]
MYRIFILAIILSITVIGFACGGQNGTGSTGGGADSPTEAYKKLYAAVKAKDIEAIKKLLTKKSIEFGLMAAQRNNTPGDKIYENGFTATTFSDTLPNIRDERVKDDMGSLEVWNSKESRWEDLPFIKEDGAWKLAVGDLFAGTFKSPGKGRDTIEKEAANTLANTAPPATNSVNTNSIAITKPTVIPEGTPAKAK